MGNRQIQLTEQDLHFLVEDAVKTYLKENGMDEWGAGLGSIFGGAGQAIKKGYGQMKQNVGNLRQNIGATYNAGENYNMMLKHKQNIEKSLEAIKNLDPQDLEYPISQIEQQLALTLDKVKYRLDTAKGRTFSTKQYNDRGYYGTRVR